MSVDNFPMEDVIKYTNVSSLSNDLSTEYATNSVIDSYLSGTVNIDKLTNGICDIGTSASTISSRLEEIADKLCIVLKEQEKEKGEKEMKGFNFDFGPVDNNDVRLSMYGLAVKNASGNYVSYNVEKDEIIDVEIFNFNNSNMLYKMPVSIKDIKPGDVIIHANRPMYVTVAIEDQKDILVVDVIAGERKIIMPTRNMFGFNFYTKVVNFLDMITDKPTNDNPFGSMWMLMAMNEEQDMSAVLPMMLMTQDNSNIDPMMMALMMGDGKLGNMSAMLPMMYMMKNNKN